MSRDKRTFVRKMFADIAARYDLLNDVLSFGLDRRWRAFAVSKCHRGGLVLDLATGTGDMARDIVRRCRPEKVVGLDFSPEMLAGARRKLAKHPFEPIELVLGDALNLPFPDATFDSVTIGYALRNVTSLERLFAEMARVLKAGGRAISLELTRPDSPLVRRLYYLHLCHIAPFVGGIISGNRAAYKYLPDSILAFPPPEEVAGIMKKAGLAKVEIYRLFLGAATVCVATKEG
jgi:demethylmenaquinone methyltransferase/2-methoxy-6-polyprenyl-1,4-benzoquinol methylase